MKNSKNKKRLRKLQDNFKRPNIQIIGVPEGEEEEQEIENIMKENFPNLAKEIDFQEVQEVLRVPKTLDPRKHTPRHIIITLPEIKVRRESQKQQEKRRQLPTKEFPLDCQLISLKQPCRQDGTRKKYLKS